MYWAGTSARVLRHWNSWGVDVWKQEPSETDDERQHDHVRCTAAPKAQQSTPRCTPQSCRSKRNAISYQLTRPHFTSIVGQRQSLRKCTIRCHIYDFLVNGVRDGTRFFALLRLPNTNSKLARSTFLPLKMTPSDWSRK